MFKTLGTALTLGLFWGSTALAATVVVGSPIKSLYDHSAVGEVNDGTIGFYIPLSGSKKYGIDKGGLKPDACSPRCEGGTLTMFLLYDTVVLRPHLLTLDFVDLDLAGANDPNGFLESVQIYGRESSSWHSFGKFTNISQASSYAPDHQVIQLPVDVQATSFIAKLVLKTENNPFWSAYNTKEFLYTSMEAVAPVPLPAAFPMFGAAIAGLFGFRLASRRVR
jgi:hypothetical protein